MTSHELAQFLEAPRPPERPEGVDNFERADPDARIHRRDGCFAADPGFEDHPAVQGLLVRARAYCLWRGKRLPTGAEWEKAARGVDRRRYPWGDEPPAGRRRADRGARPVS